MAIPPKIQSRIVEGLKRFQPIECAVRLKLKNVFRWKVN